MTVLTLTVDSPEQMEALGRGLARALPAGICVHLSGELGAGKTTLVRGYLRGLGHQGAVKSPTYTLVEPYRQGEVDIYHFDLYRINDPLELEAMGYRDYPGPDAVCLIEWPERAIRVLDKPALKILIKHKDKARIVELVPEDRLVAGLISHFPSAIVSLP